MQEAGKQAEFEELLEEVESAGVEGGALDAVCDRLQAVVASVAPPQDLLRQACTDPPSSPPSAPGPIV